MIINKPRDAASLILFKEIDNKIHFLMGRRPAKQKFMPNIFVFPGGAVEVEDSTVEYSKDFTKLNLLAVSHNCSVKKARSLGLAAIRETYEETGLLVGQPNSSFINSQPIGWNMFVKKKIKPRLDILNYFARAVTPKEQTKRFNARFFLCDAQFCHGTIEKNDELLNIDWYPIEKIIKKLKLAQVTQLVVRRAENFLENQSDKISNLTIPTYSRRKGERVIRYKVFDKKIINHLT